MFPHFYTDFISVQSVAMCLFPLPSKLKSFIDGLGVTHTREREKAILTVDADDLRLRNYLGVYFPRSYGQIRQIYSALFAIDELSANVSNEASINVLCFGIGTGDDAAGLIDSVAASKPNVKKSIFLVLMEILVR